MIKAQEKIKFSKLICKVLIFLLIVSAVLTPYFIQRIKSSQESSIKNTTQTLAKAFSPDKADKELNTVTTQKQNNSGIVKAETVDQDKININNLANDVRNTYGGTRLNFTQDQTYAQGNKAFPDGNDCIYVTGEVVAPQGVFLTNEPLVVEKPEPVAISGATDSGTGSFSWCVTSVEPILATIRVKLAHFPQTQTSFVADFTPDYEINNTTDSNAFIFGRSILFSAQIMPWMAKGVTQAKVLVNACQCDAFGFTSNCCDQPITQEQVMSCSSGGLCSATVPAFLPCSYTLSGQQNNHFNYIFLFKTSNGEFFQQSYDGYLR